MKIVFLGTPKFALPVLEKLHRDPRFTVVEVVTKPNSPVERWAKERNIIFKHQASSIKQTADLFIVVAYGKILPSKLLSIPKCGVLNVHPSLLPKYRGPSPAQQAILDGKKKTGVTIFLMDEKLDHGPILAQKEYLISPLDTAEKLYENLFQVGAKLLIEILPRWISSPGSFPLPPQDHKKATYTKLLTRRDGKIDWKKSDEEIERMIRAFDPWPSAWTTLEELIRVNQPARQQPEPQAMAGGRLDQRKSAINGRRVKILKAHLKDSKLKIDRVQIEGKRPISWEEFKRGYLKDIYNL